jgi:hypothetical protein
MAGYNPAGTLPDYVVDPSIKKTLSEWNEIFYPDVKLPWLMPLMKSYAWWQYRFKWMYR